jgi:peptidoglycan hydrolase-like protein with peptidoglycan-binding domain
VLSILFKEALAAADMPDELLRAMPTLPEAKVQSRGGIEPEQARTIQSRLVALGFLEGDVNGPWGPPSRQALRDFKATHNLPADDIWDEATERALATASAAGGKPNRRRLGARSECLFAQDEPEGTAAGGDQSPGRLGR